MTTITIKINERTKAGKTLKSLIEFFSKENNGVEIISDKKSPYSKEFVEKIKRAEKDIEEGNTITINPDDIWGSILSK